MNEPVRIAEGVHRCGTDLVNWYLVEEGGRVTIVDCGAPGYWPQLDPSLAAIGRARSDVDAVVLTHGDSDHVGFSERLRSEAGVTVWAPEGDAKLVREGKIKKTEGSPLPYLRYPFASRLLFHLARNGGIRSRRSRISRRTTAARRSRFRGTRWRFTRPATPAGTAFCSSATCCSPATPSARSTL